MSRYSEPCSIVRPYSIYSISDVLVPQNACAGSFVHIAALTDDCYTYLQTSTVHHLQYITLQLLSDDALPPKYLDRFPNLPRYRVHSQVSGTETMFIVVTYHLRVRDGEDGLEREEVVSRMSPGAQDTSGHCRTWMRKRECGFRSG